MKRRCQPSRPATVIPLEIHEEVSMKILNASQSPARGDSASRLESARALAYSLAESDTELLEPEVLVWIDRTASRASPSVSPGERR